MASLLEAKLIIERQDHLNKIMNKLQAHDIDCVQVFDVVIAKSVSHSAKEGLKESVEIFDVNTTHGELNKWLGY